MHVLPTDRSHAAEQTLTFVFLQQFVHVLYDLIILLQLQHALTVVQFQRDDHSTQINVVHVTRHLLHTHTRTHTDQMAESVVKCSTSLVRILIFDVISCKFRFFKHNSDSRKHTLILNYETTLRHCRMALGLYVNQLSSEYQRAQSYQNISHARRHARACKHTPCS